MDRRTRVSCLSENPLCIITCCSPSTTCCREHSTTTILTLRLSPHVTGGKILLNGAKLRLKRGRRYGLCGANGAGKV